MKNQALNISQLCPGKKFLTFEDAELLRVSVHCSQKLLQLRLRMLRIFWPMGLGANPNKLNIDKLAMFASNLDMLQDFHQGVARYKAILPRIFFECTTYSMIFFCLAFWNK
jgi:hypothetical protein